jgi:predicted RNA-binding protein with PUA-like domain
LVDEIGAFDVFHPRPGEVTEGNDRLGRRPKLPGQEFMREMAVGDQVLFYHSNADPPAVVGIAEVVRMAYPDETQFDRRSPHYDPDSDAANPRWDVVDIRYRTTFPEPITLDRLRQEPRLKGMVLLRKGSRLSVQPVTEAEWTIINRIAGVVRDQEPLVRSTLRVVPTTGS